MNKKTSDRYESLIKNFEEQLGRELTEKEQDFILWIVNEEYKYSDS